MTKLVRKGADQGWVHLFIRIEEKILSYGFFTKNI